MTRIDRLNDIAKLLDDGFSEKYAQYYLNLTEIELNSNAYDQKYVKWAHSKGFLAESACVYGLNETNYEYYLSDYDYYRIWPLNSWSRIWVNDKLTLKTMLCDGDFKDFMPEYYWYMQDKHIKPLMDIDVQTDDFQRAFVQHLSSVGEYACKPCNGTGSVGFVRIISLGNSQFKINSEKTDVHGLLAFVNSHPNYIYTEYIHPPSKQMPIFYDIVGTLRIVTVNSNGNDPVIIGGYMRIPNKTSGYANYLFDSSRYNDIFSLNVDVDFETGEYKKGAKVYNNRIEYTETHPDTGISLSGYIPFWKQLTNKILMACRRFSNVEYMGFDLGITDKGFRCMEINTHPGIKYMQIFHSLYDDPLTLNYYRTKVSQIDNLSRLDKEKRWEIRT